MKTNKEYRNNGAVGAVLDEYEKSILELIRVISTISVDDLCTIVDSETKDKDCMSIQSILSHVVVAGYTYVIEIRKWMGEDIEYKQKELLPSVGDYVVALEKMFAYNEQLFYDYPDLQIEEDHPDKKILVRWGQRYDVEQLMEHAIVHILRHRRQIERFLLLLHKS